MANKLVEHLREGGQAAGAGFAARWLRPLPAARWRQAVALLRSRSTARIAIGLVAAFTGGVVLGVGIAAVMAPGKSETAAALASGQATAQRKPMEQASYAVPVRVREEGRKAAPPAVADTPPPADPAKPAAAEVAPVAAAPVAVAPPVAAVPEPAPAPSVPPPAADAPRAAVPLSAMLPATPPADMPPPQSPAEMPPAAAPPADAGARPADPVAAALSPVMEQPPAASAAMPPAIQPPPADTAAGSVAPLGDQLALAPSGPFGPMPQAGGAGPAGTGPAGTGDEASTPDATVALPPRPSAKNLQLAALPMPQRGDAAWLRNAVKLPHPPGDVAIAIIVDDMGIDQKRSRLAIGLPAPLTLSFIPYGYHLPELVAAARAAGHEVMLHMPMEPLDAEADPGPNALRTSVPIEENERRLLWAFSRIDGIVGLNNHMGSKFTAWQPGMEMVMREVEARGLLFVDSFTNNASVGLHLARDRRLPAAARDVFIDHDITRVAIDHSLQELEKVARRRGFAVGIAHPHDLTREALATWIAQAKARGVDFVPISHIVQRGMKSG